MIRVTKDVIIKQEGRKGRNDLRALFNIHQTNISQIICVRNNNDDIHIFSFSAIFYSLLVILFLPPLPYIPILLSYNPI